MCVRPVLRKGILEANARAGESLVVGGSGGEAAREGLVRNRRRDGVQECRMISLARKGGSLYGIRQERPQILSRTGGAHCNLLE